MSLEDEYKRLRGYLNPTIRGKNTTAILEALAPASLHLVNNIIAMNDSLYISTASDTYLDDRMSDFGITRPETIGLSDDIFRQLGIEIINRKQVRDLIMKILEIVYGEEYTRATSNSTNVEPYFLEDGDTLIVSYDEQAPITVTFSASQFSNINFATAQEVSDTITRANRTQNSTGSAYSKDDGNGNFVVLMPGTNGPASSIRVLGGKTQNKLRFDAIRPITAQSDTQWTIHNYSGTARMTWTGGTNPSIGKARKGDYVNVYGSFTNNPSLNHINVGTFVITKVQSGTLDNAYIEFANPLCYNETAVQGSADGFLVFNPIKTTPTSKPNYALAFQTTSKVLEVYMPAVTKVIRRDRIGSAHLQDGGASAGTDYGPYIFDTTKPYSIGQEECNITQIVDSNSSLVINVDNSSSMPDTVGHIVFDFGGPKEELVPYLGRPSNNSLMINPTYKFKNEHDIGTNISLVSQNYSVILDDNGDDYEFFVTSTIDGRTYVQDLINSVAATGIIVNIFILYPDSIGIGKNEIQHIFGV